MSYIVEKSRTYNVGNVDALTLGQTTIFTTEASQGRFIVESVKVMLQTLTGVIAVAPIISVGYGVAFNETVNALTLVSAPVANQMTNAIVVATAISIPASTAVKVNVTTAGTIATVYNFEIFVRGYYEKGDL